MGAVESTRPAGDLDLADTEGIVGPLDGRGEGDGLRVQGAGGANEDHRDGRFAFRD